MKDIKYVCVFGCIKSLLRNCLTCNSTNEKTVLQPTIPASPKFRLYYSFPYQNISLDYPGPIYFKSCIHIEKTDKMVKD